MSTAPASRHPALVPAGPLVPADAAQPPQPPQAAHQRAERPAVLRLCAGEALHLGDDEVDFVDLVNAAGDLEALLLDPDTDPVSWTSRIVGDRISEVYGPRVCDYVPDKDGRPWLVIDKQGGLSFLGRDPETGRFRSQDFEDHTKTPAGVRTIPIPRQLAGLYDILVVIVHTDAQTGHVDWNARLIPGLQSESTSGQSAFRTWLKKAQTAAGVTFKPHDNRASLITDLKDGGIDERLAHYYGGHEPPNATIQDKHYDLGPYAKLLVPVADFLERQIAEQLVTDVAFAVWRVCGNCNERRSDTGAAVAQPSEHGPHDQGRQRP